MSGPPVWPPQFAVGESASLSIARCGPRGMVFNLSRRCRSGRVPSHGTALRYADGSLCGLARAYARKRSPCARSMSPRRTACSISCGVDTARTGCLAGMGCSAAAAGGASIPPARMPTKTNARLSILRNKTAKDIRSVRRRNGPSDAFRGRSGPDSEERTILWGRPRRNSVRRGECFL
jgi:hypothetical protein